MIELLIVIMLIGLLAGVTIMSYNKTRQSAELSLLTDQFITDMREIKTKTANASSMCHGFEVTEDGELINIEADYLNPFEKCDLNTIETSKKYTAKNFYVESIFRENLKDPLGDIQLFFTPPHGNIFLPGIDTIGIQTNQNNENLIFELRLGDKVNEQKVLLNRKNGTIQKIYAN